MQKNRVFFHSLLRKNSETVMFGNKRKNLPPRPSIPQQEQITEDFSVAMKSDVALDFRDKDNPQMGDLHFPTNAYDVENIYGKARTYLNGNRRLRLLTEVLNTEENKLKVNYEEIVKLAQDIRDEAQAVLIK